MDVDEAAGRDNPAIDEFRPINGDAGERWPVGDGEVDLVVCDYVVEHLPDPPATFAEVARVLRPGGVACVRTPNRWGYPALAAQVVPSRHHARVLKVAQGGSRSEVDVFPTLYRCNSTRALRRGLRAAGFADVVAWGHASEPAYLAFSRLAYAGGVLYQRWAPGFLQPVLFAFARKPGGDADAAG